MTCSAPKSPVLIAALPSQSRTLSTLGIAILAWCMLSGNANAQSGGAQLKIAKTIWGFDGRVLPGQFNPLSILIDNQTEEAVDAVIILEELGAGLSATGGQYVQPAFIAPFGRRWFQFYPYVPRGSQNEWHLILNDGDKYRNKEVGKPFTQARSATKEAGDKETARPQVIILDADESTTRPATVKHFPEDIFPPYATATVGLHTVFLDHVPDWELPRQQAFLSWLKLGGRLHLLQNGRGEFPSFSGDLVEVNQPMNRYHVGSGLVVRHPIRRDAVSEGMVSNAAVIDAHKNKDEDAEKEIQKIYQQTGQGLGQLIDIDPSSIDSELFRKMRDLTRPDHAWWLIFLLSLCYIGLIFPGCFLISKQKHLHFLTTYGAITGLSILFSLLFLIIGRRGYGESTVLHTLAVARAEDNSHWSVFQWNAFFVTSGDDYTATAPDQQMVLSIADTNSVEDAQVTAGNGGEARMRIPPFSSQTFVSRRRISSSDWKLSIADVDIQRTGLVGLSVRTGEDFPVSKDAQYMVLADRSIYQMKYNEELKQLTLFGARERLAIYCQPRYDEDLMRPWSRQKKEIDNRSPEEVFFDNALPELVQRSLMEDLVDRPEHFQLPSDRIRLYIYLPVPENFDMTVSANAKRTGRILFTKDLFLQGNPANP